MKRKSPFVGKLLTYSLIKSAGLLIALALILRSMAGSLAIDPKYLPISRDSYYYLILVGKIPDVSDIWTPQYALADTRDSADPSLPPKHNGIVSRITDYLSNLFVPLFYKKDSSNIAEVSTPLAKKEDASSEKVIEPVDRNLPKNNNTASAGQIAAALSETVVRTTAPAKKTNTTAATTTKTTAPVAKIIPVIKPLVGLTAAEVDRRIALALANIKPTTTIVYGGGGSYSVPPNITPIVTSAVSAAVSGGSSDFLGTSVCVSGNVTANAFYGDGSNLTGVGGSFSTTTTRNVFSTTAGSGLCYSTSTGIFSTASGYNIPLTASTTEWSTFYNTPCSRVIAGTGLSWTGNTLNSTVTGYSNSCLNTLSCAQVGCNNAISSGNTCASAFGYLNCVCVNACGSGAFGNSNCISSNLAGAFGIGNCVSSSGGFAFGSGITNSTGGVEIGPGNTYKLQITTNGANFCNLSGCGVCVNGSPLLIASCLSSCLNAQSLILLGNLNASACCCTSAVGYSNCAQCPGDNAFGTQNCATGTYSQAHGITNCSLGNNSSAFGSTNRAWGLCSSAFGAKNDVCGAHSAAFGTYNCIANTNFSSAGCYVTSLGLYNGGSGVSWNGSSFAAPTYCGSGLGSTMVGLGNLATGFFGTAIGYSNIAYGPTDFSAGYCNITCSNSGYGKGSVSVGVCNTTSYGCSAAIGFCNSTGGYRSSSFGVNNTSSGYNREISLFGYNNYTLSSDCSTLIGLCNCACSSGHSNIFGYCNLACCTCNSTLIGSCNCADQYTCCSTILGNCNYTVCAGLGCGGQFVTSIGTYNGQCGISWNGSNFSNSGICGSGLGSTLIGMGNYSSGCFGTAIGYGNCGSACCSALIGHCNSNSGYASFVFGSCVCNVSNCSVEIGVGDYAKLNISCYGLNLCTNNSSTFCINGNAVLGYGNCAATQCDTALGYYNCACAGWYSNAIGGVNMVCSCFGSAFGNCNLICSSSCFNTAIGYLNTASGFYSSAFGSYVCNTDNCSAKIGHCDAWLQACYASAGTSYYQFNNIGDGDLSVSSGYITSSSDERLKDIQGNFSNGLAQIQGINPILYKWNDSTPYNHDKVYAGFSAQNVLGVIPEAIGVDGAGYYSLNDRPILAASVNAIKELAQMNSSSTAAVANLKLRLDNLELIGTSTTSQSIPSLPSILESFGASIIDGIVHFAQVFIEKLTTSNLTIKNSVDVSKTGYVIYDRATGQPICVYFENGVQKTETGDCDVPPTGSGSGSGGNGSGGTGGIDTGGTGATTENTTNTTATSTTSVITPDNIVFTSVDPVVIPAAESTPAPEVVPVQAPETIPEAPTPTPAPIPAPAPVPSPEPTPSAN